MTLQEILENVKSGSVSVEEAERILKKESYEEMGYAKLDTSRKARTGFAEVIYCSNKADEHLLNIFERLYREDGEVFGTRASEHQYELVKEKFPQVEYDPISHILKIEKKDKKRIGKVAAFRLHYLPLASIGLSWVVPALVGLVLGLGVYFYKKARVSVGVTEKE